METGNPGLTAKKLKFLAAEFMALLQQNAPLSFLIKNEGFFHLLLQCHYS